MGMMNRLRKKEKDKGKDKDKDCKKGKFTRTYVSCYLLPVNDYERTC
jgi:hypothetical protein